MGVGLTRTHGTTSQSNLPKFLLKLPDDLKQAYNETRNSESHANLAGAIL